MTIITRFGQISHLLSFSADLALSLRNFFIHNQVGQRKMNIIELIIQVTATILSCFAALISILLFLPLRWPAPVLWILKLFISGASVVFASVGVVCTIIGVITGSFSISIISLYVFLIFSIHIFRITRPPDFTTSFDNALGWQLQNHIQKEYFLPSRTILRLPVVPDALVEQDIQFATIPGTCRKLLCDVWQPSKSIPRSGLAFIYLHGSAFYLLDKDCGTRPLFRQLTAQGHVVMDVAYRLSPETDMMGMVNDVKRAIAWMRKNAGLYGVNANRIVIGGGSAGAHLALLAAYTSNNSQFTPAELMATDISVNGVISFYGISDLTELYYHTGQHLTTRSVPGKPKKTVPIRIPEWIVKRMGEDYHRLGFDKGFEDAGALAPLLGGHPDECPETYALFSPITHVHNDCPPTLLIHGEHDTMTPVKSIRFLYSSLIEKRVEALIHILPQTDHAFDLIMPDISPSAHNALYDVERFLEFIIGKDK